MTHCCTAVFARVLKWKRGRSAGPYDFGVGSIDELVYLSGAPGIPQVLSLVRRRLIT